MFRTIVRRKEIAMLALSLFAALAFAGGWPLARGLAALLRRIPRSNDDLVFF